MRCGLCQSEMEPWPGALVFGDTSLCRSCMERGNKAKREMEDFPAECIYCGKKLMHHAHPGDLPEDRSPEGLVRVICRDCVPRWVEDEREAGRL